ncbi:MAG: 4-hydroxy-tetrahydrodipicolinate synthase [Candidatus Algichlamydia australiensis]|nr:4-hydroxy-tetrahydrodipicolinate synthase [Chlamydiales bacterium]
MFYGSIVALVTPYKENLEVDYETLRALVRFQVESGTSAIVALGTTGEHLLLTDAEREDIVATVVEEVAGRVPVIVNVGVAATTQSLLNAKRAKTLGADALLVITPYYVKPSENGVVSHMNAVAKVDLPIMFYYNPARTGLTLSKECIKAVLQIPNVVAIKDATVNLEWARTLKTNYFADDPGAASGVMQSGGKGLVSVIANLYPKEWKEVVSGNESAEAFKDLLNALSLETNPQCIKYAMSKLGLCNSRLRLPLVEPSDETKRAIDVAMSNSFTYCLSNS